MQTNTNNDAARDAGQTNDDFISTLRRQQAERFAGYRYFIDFKPVAKPNDLGKTREIVNLFDTLCSFQYYAGSSEEHTFTVLDPSNGRAFSQTYQKTEPGYAKHGNAFRHEAGLPNPTGIPSYDELLALPDPAAPRSIDYTIIPDGGSGSIYLVRPHNDAAREHLKANAQDDAQWHAGSLVVEHRYIVDLVHALRDLGFTVD